MRAAHQRNLSNATPNMAWLDSYQMANGMRPGGGHVHPHSYGHQRNGSFHCNHRRNDGFLPPGHRRDDSFHRHHQRNDSFVPNHQHRNDNFFPNHHQRNDSFVHNHLQRNDSFVPNHHQQSDSLHYNHRRDGSFLPARFASPRSQGRCGSPSSSDSSASRTSSSYTGNTERTTSGGGGDGGGGGAVGGGGRARAGRSPRRTVQFKSPRGDSKFDRAMRRVQIALNRPFYRSFDNDDERVGDTKQAPMFWCPKCKTKQRDFITVATASNLYDSPQGYLALYFAIYLSASLFIFGLQEGWDTLDCIYFSVITLTTAGLGDFAPSTDSSKIACAFLIYVGVANIGLLLGSLLAGSMDTARKIEAREAQIRDCPNCARIEKLKRSSTPTFNNRFYNMGDGYGEIKQDMSYTPSDASSFHEDADNVGLDLFYPGEEASPTRAPSNSSSQQTPAQIHTRHMSIDIVGSSMRKIFAAKQSGGGSSIDGMPPPIDETTPFMATAGRQLNEDAGTRPKPMDTRSSDDSYSIASSSSDSISLHPSKPLTRVKAAKIIFTTLNRALMNSLLIIAGGSVGFYYIEHMTPVDSFYFTTVLLTSVGYGDIVPVTTTGKVFATIFVIVAGTVLLHQMTLISMIPLLFRKRRIEQAVLEQFGNQLTDDELRELSTGRLINRLKLATNRPVGLEECTREMFSLAMLVRLGRISEADVSATFAAFRRLDIGNYGKLNSRSIIEGEFMRQKSVRNLVTLSPPEEWSRSTQHYSRENMSQGASCYAVEYASPNQFLSPTNESLSKIPSVDYSQGSSPQGMVSRASDFDYDAYERWASQFNQYSPSNNNMGGGEGLY